MGGVRTGSVFGSSPQSAGVKARIRTSFIASLLVVFLALCFQSELQAKGKIKQILMIHSYRWGMLWTDGQVEGFMKTIRDSGTGMTISLEHMDVVGQPAPYDYEKFADYLTWRYEGKKFDLIVTTDTDALKFVALKYTTLFNGVPVVFSDVFGIDDIAIPDEMPFTGVKELRDFQPTIDLARRVQPRASRIVVFGNKKMSGAGPRLAQKFFEHWDGDLPLEFHFDKPFEDIVDISRRISPDDIVFNFSYAFDAEGVFRGYGEVRDRITASSRAPVFSFWQSSPRGGIGLGGKISTAIDQGRVAAELSLRVLNGEDPRSIPIESAPTKFVFDYRVMERLNIKPRDLPAGAVFQNRPHSIYKEFETEIWSAVAAFLMLITIIIALLQSISRRKLAEEALIESEERFREFAALGADWFWEADNNLRFNYISEGIEQTFGLRTEAMLGKSRQEMFEDNQDTDTPEWRNHLAQLQKHEPFTNFEMMWTRPDGKRRDISISGVPLYDNDGFFKGYRGVGRDVTVLKRATKGLQDALAEAEKANSSKSVFMAKLSHEFRTPLNAILGFSEMMRENYFGPLGSPRYENYVGDILFSAKHMLALVDDVLDISAIESGELSLDIEEIDIGEAVEHCIRSFERAEILGTVELVRNVPDGLAPLHADSRALSQIILNLLSNAVKFTGSGGRVTISAYEQSGSSIIEISDTGAGIPPESLKEVIKPFTQATLDPHKAQEGAGLGLAIVQALVDSHGGKLNIASEFGHGTTVTVTFPTSGMADFSEPKKMPQNIAETQDHARFP